ncbi:MAG: hypothetical protein KF729_00900 [Sandaracinaceae bacterium]|nr:hypothetical protein [Sandaracinaceae bacterium]
MWLTLILFVAAAAVAVVRRKEDGWRVAAIGGLLCLASGVTGFATGLYATVAYAAGVAAEARAETLGVGLSESSNNLLFAGLLAACLAVAGLALSLAGRRGAAAA